MRVAGMILATLLAGACAFDVEPEGTLGANPDAGPTVSFRTDIQPLFASDCALCHGGAGGLSLESYESLLLGGVSGPVVTPGNPDDSILVRRLEGTLFAQMPLGLPPLTQPEIDRVRQWIAEGALDN